MAITEAQRQKRQKYIGSSDVHDIVTNNAHAVWLEKTGKVEPQKQTDVMLRGHFMELSIIPWAAMILGPIITDPEQLEFTDEDKHYLSHPDGLLDRTGNPIESKSQGAYAKEVWGDEYTDAVPDRALLQAHFHMICMERDFCHVPAHLAYREFQMFGVERSAKIVQMIVDSCGHFWDEHVVKDIPPEEGAPSLEVLKRIRRVPDTIAEVSDVKLGLWLGAVELRKKAQSDEERMKANVIAELGQAEAGQCEDGYLVTFYEQNTGGLLTKELRQAHPDIAAKFANPARHRVLRVKKG